MTKRQRKEMLALAARMVAMVERDEDGEEIADPIDPADTFKKSVQWADRWCWQWLQESEPKLFARVVRIVVSESWPWLGADHLTRVLVSSVREGTRDEMKNGDEDHSDVVKRTRALADALTREADHLDKLVAKARKKPAR